jgi:hypothetical protein
MTDIISACRSYRYNAIKRETIWEGVMPKQVLCVIMCGNALAVDE